MPVVSMFLLGLIDMTVDLSNVHLQIAEDGELELYIGGYYLCSPLISELSAEVLTEIRVQVGEQNVIPSQL